MKKNRVLIVDDAGFIREILTRICESAGYYVVGEAVDGETAFSQALRLKPDIILMDIVMPRKNGIEATKEILKKNPEITIIACSTIDDELMKEQVIEAGCVAYVNKPFSRLKVLEALDIYGNKKIGESKNV